MKRLMILALLTFGLAVFTPGQNVDEKSQGKDKNLHPPQASASPASLDFGDQEVQTLSKQLRLTLTNNAGKRLEIRGVDPGEEDWEDFDDDDDACTGVSLEAGKTCSVGVTFTPHGVGARSAFLLIAYDDDPDHPQKVSLKGNGIKPRP